MNPSYKQIAIAGVALSAVLLGAGGAGAFEDSKAMVSAPTATAEAAASYQDDADRSVAAPVVDSVDEGPAAVGAELERLLASSEDPLPGADRQLGVAL